MQGLRESEPGTSGTGTVYLGTVYLLALFCAASVTCLGASIVLASPEKSWILPATENEIKIGNAVDAFAQQRFVMLDAPDIQAEIEVLGQKLLSASGSRPVPYRFKVININDINAFSAPGGFIYMMYGMLQLAQTKDEIAAVVAHEIAHVELRHHMKSYRSQQAVQLMMTASMVTLIVTGNDDIAKLVRQVGPIGAMIGLNTFSRSQEYAADDYAFLLLMRSGYDLRGFPEIFRRMERKRLESERNHTSMPTLFLTHPSLEARIRRLEKKIAEIPDLPSSIVISHPTNPEAIPS